MYGMISLSFEEVFMFKLKFLCDILLHFNCMPPKSKENILSLYLISHHKSLISQACLGLKSLREHIEQTHREQRPLEASNAALLRM